MNGELQQTNSSEANRINLKIRAPRMLPSVLECLATTMLLLLLPALVAAQTCTPAPTNMVAWWPGDGHTYDVINGKAAALQNGADYAVGEVAQAFNFNGSLEKVRIPESTKTDLSRTNTWTIEAWVRPTSFASSLYPTIYSEGNKIASLGLNNGTGKLESWINNDPDNTFVSTLAVTNNAWNHVALVRNGPSRTFYVNGQAAGTTNSTPDTTADSTGAAIGNVTIDDPTSAFPGQIDEVSLYHRALPAGEISSIYNAGVGGKCYTNSSAPVFVIQPVSETNYLGGAAAFTALAMGTPRPTYQWQFRATGQTKFAALASQTNYNLTLSNLTFANDGDYAQVASSSSGVTTSVVAHLTVMFCEDTPAGLVAWWPGDGSGLDVTSNHNGAVWGGVTYPPGVVTNGPAFGFNGTDAYVAVPDSPDLSPHVGTNGEMTLEAWVYMTNQPSAWTTVLAKGDSSRWEYALHINPAGVPVFYVWTPDGSSNIVASGGLITPTNWHHLVGTLKKGQFIRLYQNGTMMNESTNASIDSAHGATPLYLGRRHDAYFFNGRVDEAALYNRALDTNQITSLYALGKVGKCAGATTPAPWFPVQPANQSGYYFLSAGLSALALGTPRPDYQWYRSNSPTVWTTIAGATNATLSFTNLAAGVEGFYKLSASNIYGSVTSQPAFLSVVCHPIVCGNTNGEDFENGWDGWTTDNYAIWQVGVPTSGPGSAHHGAGVAATVLDGNYPRYANSRLISPPFVVPGAAQNPRLRFWHWFNTWGNGDYGYVEIKEVGSNTWVKVSPNYDDYSGAWTRALIDLSAYSGRTVQLAFHFVDDGGDTGWPNYTPTLSSGWYIDEVKVETGPWVVNNPEGFEGGLGDWYAERGVWAVGSGGYAGNNCLATVPGGNYPRYTDSRAISPPFVVPGAAQNPRLRFWHWFDTWSPDNGYVELRVVGSNTWMQISPNYVNYSGAWTRALVDLSAYSGSTVQLAFHFVDDGGDTGWPNYTPTLSSGWYIDEVKVETGPWVFNNPEGFEGGLGDWYAERGVWEVGTPTSGPGTAHSGTQCLATILGGNYPRYTDSRAISPPFMVPEAGQSPNLVFSHWMSTWNDWGVVEAKEVGSNTWTAISPNYTTTSGLWRTNEAVSLSAYGGKTIQVAFHFVDDGGDTGWPNYTPTLSSGWYIDDVFIKRGNMVISPVSDKTVDELTPLCFQVQVLGVGPDPCLSFSLGSGAPAGASIDPEAGVFCWTPSECQGPGTYLIPIFVVDYCNSDANDLTVVKVTVNEVNQPPWLLPGSATAYVGKTNYFTLCSGDPDCPPNPLSYSLPAPVPTGVSIDSAGTIRWAPTAAQVGDYSLKVQLCDGGSPNLCVTNTFSISVTTNAPFTIGIVGVASNSFRFTLRDGRTDLDYILQESLELCLCPCQTVWQDVLRVSPITIPYSFEHTPTNFNDEPKKLFRLREAPRTGAIVPSLNVASAGSGQITISWTPATAIGWALQQSPSLSPTGWMDVPGGTNNPITLPVTPPARFYRLTKP